MIRANCKLVLFFFIGMINMASSRVYETSFLFSQFQQRQGWIFIDKMTFQLGSAHVKLESRVQGQSLGGISNNTILALQAIPEQDWASEEQLKCNSKQVPGMQAYHKLVPPSAEATTDMTGANSLIISVDKDTMYYFVLKDCQKRLKADYNNTKLTLHLRLTLTNNGREVGAEEDHWYILPIIILAGTWMAFYNKDGILKGGQTDWPKMALFMGIATNISSLTWRTFGYVIYVLSGWDYLFFHLVYLLMHSISECFVIGLLMLIALGWSINFQRSREFDLYLPMMLMLGVLNVITTILTKINNRHHDRHHMFDSIPGVILISFRALLVPMFLLAVFLTYRSSRHKVKEFIVKFAIFGALYICSLPVIWLWANYNIEEKNQNQFVFVTVEIMKTVCNIMLTYTLSNKKSQYQSVAYSNNSFLPDSPGFN